MPSCIVETPLGSAKICGDKNGISSLSIGDPVASYSDCIPEELKACVEQLKAYFNGELNSFDLKLNPEGTTFQKKVWGLLQTIPYGKTISYLDLSKKLGDVNAIRAVAAANGRNPIWLVIPCHRVIGSDGSLTGYAGGIHRKQWLLRHEGSITQTTLFNV